MSWDMFSGPLTRERVSIFAGWMWMVLGALWLAMWFTMKRAKKIENPLEIAQHAIPAIVGFWLIFEKSWKWAPLQQHVLPDVPSVWVSGLVVTVAGVAMAIWARFSLGRNWSGVVTLKDNHQLVGSGPYRWIRHPIYTGILVAAVGTAMIHGHLRAWIGVAVLLLTFYFKARREEKFLQQEFGSGFEEHARRTGMFLPRWM
ncbi:MAG: isoprenylcysteine carboxylmethyltransferase family protein [Candidatus Acidiferrum sp.]